MNIYLTYLLFYSYSSKYGKWYRNIINNALHRPRNKKVMIAEYGYVEYHHILPKCMCNDKIQITDIANKVYLTAKEHFICHLLLSKMFPTNNKLKHAITCFRRNKTGNRKLTSGQYSMIRKTTSAIMSINNKGKMPWNTGKCHSIETKLKISKSNTGRIPWNKLSDKIPSMTKEEANKLQSSRMKINNPMHELENIEKIRAKALYLAQSICCVQCKRVMGPSNFSRHKH